MNAWDDLQEFLEGGEEVESVVFGPWGWGYHREGREWALGYGEPDPPPVPFDMRGILMDPLEAMPLMRGWSFDGGYGAPMCYAVRIWTNRRVIWVTQYDGSTWLDSAPRHPTAHMPDMPGG